MIYQGQFIDINNEHLYDVKFVTPSGAGSREINPRNSNPVLAFSGEEPCVIETEADELFAPLKCQSAKIKLASRGFLFDLYSTGYDVTAEVKKNNTSIFKGYVTPCIYQQDYDLISTVSIECISTIAVLKYKDYETILPNNQRGIYTVYEILKHCLAGSAYTSFTTITKAQVGIDNTLYNDFLKHIYLDETNFFDDNEEQTPWKTLEVIEEIMKILGLSLVEDNGNLWLINYKDGMNASCLNVCYDMTDDSVSYESSYIAIDSIQPSMYHSSSNGMSLDDTFQKVIVKANTYPYENIFETILDADQWQLLDVYNTSLSSIYNTMNVPSVKWKFGDKATQAYFLYFKSAQMSPYQYYINNNDALVLESYDYSNAYIDALLVQPTIVTDDGVISPTIDKRYKVGVALMKMASYDISKATLVSSLTWKNHIVLYTGLANFNLAGTTDSALKTRVMNYLSSNFMVWSSTNNYLPKNPFLKFESASNIIISSDSYLVINGNICVNDVEYEGSVREEWQANENFKKPQGYLLSDPKYDVEENEREYFGFPALIVQCRVGDKICCSKVTTSGVNAYRKLDYEWATVDQIASGMSGYVPYVTIPVGTDSFGFYRFHEITNTCDWRLGLDNAKGFAIPMMKSAGLHGKLQIYIVGPDDSLYSRYVSSVSKLPTTQKQVITVYRNPADVFNNPAWSDLALTYGLNYIGTYPNCILIQDLSVDIKEVKYYSFTDTQKKKADNKKTDHQYENMLNASNVNDSKSIECKINTQDLSKFKSFSSLFKLVSSDYDYIQKMSMDGGLNYRTQENNVIDDMKNHYTSPKVIFECDLKGTDFSSVQMMANYYMSGQPKMFVNKQTKNLKEASTDLQLIEI